MLDRYEAGTSDHHHLLHDIVLHDLLPDLLAWVCSQHPVPLISLGTATFFSPSAFMALTSAGSEEQELHFPVTRE